MRSITKAACIALTLLVSMSALADEKKLSVRGLLCESMEFNEINTYPKEELEALYCSYSKGHKIVTKTTDEGAARNKGTPTEIAILRDGLRKMEQCRKELFKVSDLLKRKYSVASSEVRCEEYKGYAN